MTYRFSFACLSVGLALSQGCGGGSDGHRESAVERATLAGDHAHESVVFRGRTLAIYKTRSVPEHAPLVRIVNASEDPASSLLLSMRFADDRRVDHRIGPGETCRSERLAADGIAVMSIAVLETGIERGRVRWSLESPQSRPRESVPGD